MARLWQIFAATQPGQADGKLTCVRNFRRVPELGLGESYLGNALTNARTGYDIAAVREAPLASLALQLRDAGIAAVALDKVLGELSFLWRHRHLRAQGIMALTRQDLGAFGNDHLMINNMSRFPVRELDFGTGAPFWVGGVKQAASPSIGIFPLSGCGAEGYALHLSFGRSQMQEWLRVARGDPLFDVPSSSHS